MSSQLQLSIFPYGRAVESFQGNESTNFSLGLQLGRTAWRPLLLFRSVVTSRASEVLSANTDPVNFTSRFERKSGQLGGSSSARDNWLTGEGEEDARRERDFAI